MTTREYLRPGSMSELLEAMACPDSMVLAGGTDIVPHLRSGLVQASKLVSIRDVPELSRIIFAEDHIHIGAGVRLQELIDHPRLETLYPVISKGLALIGAPQHRNQGTIGGNLCLDTRCYQLNQSLPWRDSLGFCLKHEGTLCHVAPKGRGCYAVMSSDGTPVFAVLDTTVHLASRSRTRSLPLISFYKNDGCDHLDIRPGEVLTHLTIPLPGKGFRANYQKLRARNSFDFPMLGVAAAAEMDGNIFRTLRFVLTAVESNPIYVDGAREGWTGKAPDATLISQIQDHCFKHARPMQNTFGVLAWRKKMVPVLVKRACEALQEGN